MRLGISSFTYSWAVGVRGLPPERPLGALALVERAAALGVKVLQFGDNLPLARLPEGEIVALAERAGALDISLEVGTRGIAPENLRTYLALAERLHSPILRVVIDTAEHRPSEDEAVAMLRGAMPEFERAGVCLAIENHDRFPVRKLARLVERVGSEAIGICLDVANSLGCMEGPQLVLDALGPLAVNLHLKDFVVRRHWHNLGFVIEGCPVGEGALDVPWLLSEMRRHGRDVNAILEQWTPPEATLEASIRKEEAWAEAGVRTLRRYIPG